VEVVGGGITTKMVEDARHGVGLLSLTLASCSNLHHKIPPSGVGVLKGLVVSCISHAQASLTGQPLFISNDAPLLHPNLAIKGASCLPNDLLGKIPRFNKLSNGGGHHPLALRGDDVLESCSPILVVEKEKGEATYAIS
jgi:hypothetical protein